WRVLKGVTWGGRVNAHIRTSIRNRGVGRQAPSSLSCASPCWPQWRRGELPDHVRHVRRCPDACGSTTFQGWKAVIRETVRQPDQTPAKQLTSASATIKKKRRSADRGALAIGSLRHWNVDFPSLLDRSYQFCDCIHNRIQPNATIDKS